MLNKGSKGRGAREPSWGPRLKFTCTVKCTMAIERMSFVYERFLTLNFRYRKYPKFDPIMVFSHHGP